MKTVDELLMESDGGPVHTKTIRWTRRDGSQSKVIGPPSLDRDQAIAEAFILAKQQGWTPPKWWQWWRWNDTRAEQSKPKSTN